MSNIIKNVVTGVVAVCIIGLAMFGYHEFDCGYWRRKAINYIKDDYSEGSTIIADHVGPDGTVEARVYDENGELSNIVVVYTKNL